MADRDLSVVGTPDPLGEPRSSMEEDAWFTRNILCHRAALRGYLLKLSGSQADADDLEQEAYLRVFEACRRTVIHNPRAFLFRTAYNLFVQGYRKKKNSPVDQVSDFESLNVKDMCAAADDQIIARERLGALADAVDQLPAQSRRIFIMRKVYLMSHEEIQEALGISRRTIERHVVCGLQACKEYLAHHEESKTEQKAESGKRKKGGFRFKKLLPERL